MDQYADFCYDQSKLLTKHYSTSFYLATKLLDKDVQRHIYAIYGMVRVADELVDSLKPANSQDMLKDFEAQVHIATKTKLSLNPVLQAFAITFNEYSISAKLVQAFFVSMRMDITKKNYSQKEYKVYIYGSAEVIGLMCLYVFAKGDNKLYSQLESGAKSLGSAFQKVNFLRDLQADHDSLARVYFPDVEFTNFSVTQKEAIEKDIAIDFKKAQRMISSLPTSSRFGVMLAYQYYFAVFRKIKRKSPAKLKVQRVHVFNGYKVLLFAGIYVKKLLS